MTGHCKRSSTLTSIYCIAAGLICVGVLCHCGDIEKSAVFAAFCSFGLHYALLSITDETEYEYSGSEDEEENHGEEGEPR